MASTKKSSYREHAVRPALSRAVSGDDLVSDPSFACTLELVRRGQRGDSETREEVARRYGPRFRKIERLRLGDKLRLRYDSMDVLQETLFAAAAARVKYARAMETLHEKLQRSCVHRTEEPRCHG